METMGMLIFINLCEPQPWSLRYEVFSIKYALCA